MKTEKIVWEPIKGSSQEIALHLPVNILLYTGNRGVGKTAVMLADFAKQVGKGYGSNYRGLILRNEFKGLDDIVQKGKEFFYKVFPGCVFRAAKDSFRFIFPQGEELVLGFGDSEQKYNSSFHGHQYPWIGFDEITNWSNSDFFDNIMTCNRSPVKGMVKRVFITTNSYGVGHEWVKRRFITPDKQAMAQGKKIVTTDEGLTQAVVYGSLLENYHLMEEDPSYIAKLRSIKNKAKRESWLYGSWDLQIGGFFDDLWVEEFHVKKPFPIPRTWRIDRSLDWGKAKPFSVNWWAESDGSPIQLEDGTRIPTTRGDLFMIHEWYGMREGQENVGIQMNPSAVADIIKDIDHRLEKEHHNTVRPGVADSAIYGTDAEKTVATYMQERGVTWEKSVKGRGSRVNGWAVVADMLEAAILKTDPLYFAHKGYPEPEDSYIYNKRGLYIWNNCKHSIRTVYLLKQDVNNLDDVDTEVEDHAWDSIRYRCTHGITTTTMGDL